MLVFKDVGEAIDHFDGKAKLFRGFLKDYPNDKAIQGTVREYVEWHMRTVSIFSDSDKGYEEAAEFVNSLRDNNGQLFLVPSKQLY